ncbi:MAG: DUF924 family protein [Pseudomonadota bacterium]
MSEADISAITGFWRAAGSEVWFRKDAAFDSDFRQRFEALHWRAARRELDDWQASAEGAFALMILLDQFPRNCFRGTGHMYATDPLARYHARLSVAAGHDKAVEEAVRLFFYLPFSHSEDLADQHHACALSEHLGEEMMKHARRHRDIVARFGRFPHRNPILARESSAEELQFLADGGFAG